MPPQHAADCTMAFSGKNAQGSGGHRDAAPQFGSECVAISRNGGNAGICGSGDD